jgi:hypothetical protein
LPSGLEALCSAAQRGRPILRISCSASGDDGVVRSAFEERYGHEDDSIGSDRPVGSRRHRSPSERSRYQDVLRQPRSQLGWQLPVRHVWQFLHPSGSAVKNSRASICCRLSLLGIPSLHRDPNVEPSRWDRIGPLQLPLVGSPSRDQDRYAVVVQIGAALGIVYVCETPLVERIGAARWALGNVLNPTFLSPLISSSMPHAIVCTVIAPKRPPRCLARCATAECQNASHKNECSTVCDGTHLSIQPILKHVVLMVGRAPDLSEPHRTRALPISQHVNFLSRWSWARCYASTSLLRTA